MKITSLYVYPIKSLRGISLQQAHITPRGVQYDRHFILYEEVVPAPSSSPSQTENNKSARQPPILKKIQLDSHPKSALFEQTLDQKSKTVDVRFLGPSLPADDDDDDDDGAHSPAENGEKNQIRKKNLITVPLEPDVSSLKPISADLHGSAARAYEMGEGYDAWFSARFGVKVKLVYIGDGKRAVLGETLPPPPRTTAEEGEAQTQTQNTEASGSGSGSGSGKGWLSTLTSLVTGPARAESVNQKVTAAGPWLTFTDVAPLLVASESSLEDVSARLPEENRPMPMYKFRPNVVVDGRGEAAWAEDFWAELTVESSADPGGKLHRLSMTGNCVRCISLNVDYETGRPAEGEMGNVLKKLMKDRRVDAGSKWSPVFGRYGFPPLDDEEGFVISVGDEVQVAKRNADRTVWDWPGL
ncbi:molybdenum cofactor sulfurase [Cladorrhinum samala]|uniref:Molybdenum cofactor sulfurase n=1 Tax=Cladorrhinum samala TaxID=585594 RepID=A0AAV9HY97_9PEZI|nr:molybdenum cofactor sulfurase [Cladorrhinum samala]